MLLGTSEPILCYEKQLISCLLFPIPVNVFGRLQAYRYQNLFSLILILNETSTARTLRTLEITTLTTDTRLYGIANSYFKINPRAVNYLISSFFNKYVCLLQLITLSYEYSAILNKVHHVPLCIYCTIWHCVHRIYNC